MSDIKFRPVRGLEANILAMEYTDGYIYYATDTKKIYLDANGQSKILMGGSSGIFYGQMTLDETPDSAQREFDFNIFDIEGNSNLERLNVPDVDDLILNIPDGCFYRVTSATGTGADIVISTIKLTIAGSGSSTGPSGPNVGTYSMDRLTPQTTTTLFGSSYSVGFSIYAADASGEQTGSGSYRLLVGNVEKERGTIPQGDNYLDVSPYLALGENTIKVIVSLDIGSSDNITTNKTWYITTTQMELDWDPHENGIEIYNTNSPLTLSWSVSGVDINKTTYIMIDDTYPIEVGPTKSTNTQQYRITNPSEFNLTHGTHKFSMRAGTLLADAADEKFTPYVYHNLMFKNPTDTSPIIRMDLFNTTLTQYNTIPIPIYLYSEDNITNNATLILKEDGVEKDTWENVINKAENIWTYTPTTPGTHILSVHCGEVEVSRIINVTALDIDNEEVPGYTFRFKASDFASNNAVQNWNVNGITASFSEKFDWINGGLKTEKDEAGGNRQYMAVKAGSTMTINYPLWAQNAPGYGKTLKIIFKTANCRDYDAQVLSCKTDKKIIKVDKNVEYLMYFDDGITLTTSKLLTLNGSTIELNSPIEAVYDITDEDSRNIFEKSYIIFEGTVYECHFVEVEKENEDDPTLYYAVWYKTSVEDSFDGLLLNAQAAILRSRSNVVSTQYCEDSYIELEFDITKYDRNNIKNYMKFWVDGVPSGYVIYSSDDAFTGADKITIGSIDCDVHIYMIKLYETSLTNNEHLQNFIADAPNAEEMIKRFKRNDILDERNEISPTLLAKANKDCLVHVYEIDRMTRTKKDKVPHCTYDQYHGSDQVSLHAENVTIKVQGTSSEKYVVSAANIDSDFYDTENGGTGFIDTTTGTELGETGWSMDGGTAIPCNFFCSKVNVASCENANNALNQEWYNLFQPYKTVLRCKYPNARDTMQFTNGVLFMKDKNQTFSTEANADKKLNNLFGETAGYLNSPYPKFYSLTNMGNSKDNIHVFHDQSNPLECCIEVKDNQTQQQWMVSDSYNKADIGEDEDYFEFRYPDGVKNASQEMINGWNDFVTWMATSNPQPRYEKHTATTEKEFKTFSYNQKTHKNVPTYALNPEQTEYILVESFNPEINTYYTETEHIYGYTNLPLETPKTYGDYTFSGYRAENQKRENGELWQKDYDPMIEGCVVTKYKGTYTHDTYEYRMAKMLNECEDHLVMDSVIYHYLFIERHCMIDNVAKNTFWSTEDCQHWNLVKDYDNDTADGNDNNGKFTRNYGMEPLDMLNANTYVFNAHQSVWLNFIHGLQEAREHMYQKLEEKTVRYNGRDLSVWSKDDYLWLFKEWQSRIPERCWIEDYYRKYFRPYELYNDTMFNSMMEGGQKTHQREQYETYQETYMSSEYNGKDCRSSYMLVRSNGKNMLGYELPVEVYSDCYIRMDTGSDTSVQRVKRNTRANFVCPTNSLNNATMYFYPAKTFSLIGDVNGGKLGEMLPEQVSFAQAGKLRELVVATPDSSMNVTLKQGFSVLNNNLLEKLYVSNLGAYTEGLDLSKCPNLLEVNAVGSTFTAVEIANNAPVTTIKLESPTTLTLSNLTELQTLEIEDYRKLQGLKLNNIDKSGVNSKDILETAIRINSALTGDYSLDYTLTNVDWTMNESDDVVNKKITLLEYLLTKCQPNWNADRTEREPLSMSLTGDLLIGDNAYSGSESFDIYNTYVNEDVYPGLDINFTHSNAKLYTVDIYDGNNKVYWTRKIVKGQNIDDDFLSDGPIGTFNLNKVLKGSTPAYIYQFARQWEVYRSNDLTTIIDTIDNQENGLPYYNNVQFDITLKPIFTRIDRTYNLTFYGVDVNTPFRVLEKIKYGTAFTDVVDMLTEIPYKEYQGSELKAAYDFVGYALLKDSSTKVPDDYIVANDQSFFAIFEYVSDISKVVHYEDWFTFTPYAYLKDKDYSDINIIPKEDKYLQYLHNNKSYMVTPKVQLKGKITIPAKYNNKPVVAIGGFGALGEGDSKFNHEVTHVFCEEGSQLYEIRSFAFRFLTSLKYFDFSQNTVRFIDSYAFQGCESMDASLTSQNESRFKLSSELFFIGQYGLTAALQSPTVTELSIPSKVVLIGENGFCFQNIAEGSTLRIGSETIASQLLLADPGVTTNITTAPRFVQNQSNHYKNIYFFSTYYESAEDIIANEVKVQDIFFGGYPESYPNTTITIRKV